METLITEIRDMIKIGDAYWKIPGIGSQREIGLMEFDISNIKDIFSSGQMEANSPLQLNSVVCWITTGLNYIASRIIMKTAL